MMNTYKDVKQEVKNLLYRANKQIEDTHQYPGEVLEQLGELGYLGYLIPREYGGGGKSLEDFISVVRAFAELCPTVALIYVIHSAPLLGINENDNTWLKEKVFTDVIENNAILTGAHSEKPTGITCISEFELEKTGNQVIFSGQKNLITSSGKVAYYYLSVPGEQEGTVDYWVLPSNLEGIKPHPSLWNGLGMVGNIAAPVDFDDVSVPIEFRAGSADLMSTIAFNLGLGAVSAGLADGLYQAALTHSLTRKFSNGSHLSDIETVRLRLADIFKLSYAAKAGLYYSASMINDSSCLQQVLAARSNATEAAIQTAILAMRVGGGTFYNKISQAEQFLRDSLAGQVMVPGIDLMNQIIMNMELHDRGE